MLDHNVNPVQYGFEPLDDAPKIVTFTSLFQYGYANDAAFAGEDDDDDAVICKRTVTITSVLFEPNDEGKPN